MKTLLFLWKGIIAIFNDRESELIRGLILGAASVAAIIWFGMTEPWLGMMGKLAQTMGKLTQTEWVSIGTALLQTFAAIGAGWMALHGIRKQIRQQQVIVDMDHDGQMRAAKALLQNHQVARSRSQSAVLDRSRLIFDRDRSRLAADWIVIRFLAEQLFPYARGDSACPASMDLSRLRISGDSNAFVHSLEEEICKALENRRKTLKGGAVRDFMLNEATRALYAQI